MDPLDHPLSVNALIISFLFRAGKLNDKFLPPEEFQIVWTKPISQWPESLKQKLRPWLGEETEDEEET